MEVITDYQRKAHTPIRHQEPSFRDRTIGKLYFERMDREQYGSPKPAAPVETPYRAPREAFSEIRATINKLENDINGLKRMSHSHARKGKNREDCF